MNKELIAKLRESAATKIISRSIDDPDTQKLAMVLIPPLNGGNGVFDDFMAKYAELIWKEAYEQGYDKGMSDCCDGQGGV